MIVSCPTCSTRYTLTDSSIGADGRKVRCAKCGHTWRQMPAPADDGHTVTMADAPTEIRPPRSAKADSGKFEKAKPGKAKPAKAKAPKAPRQPPRKSTVIGFAVLGAVVAGAGLVGWLARDRIVAAWPPAALFYETVGLPVPPPGSGLELRNIHSEQRLENGATVLVLDGEVVNVTDADREPPPLTAIALDGARKPLRSWTLSLSADTLAPGAVATFHHSQPDPGPVAEITITFGPPPVVAADKAPAAGAAPAEKPAADKHAAPAAHGKPASH